LLLARGLGRQKEMAVRAALGAGRIRLFRQLLTESLLLSAAGGAAAILASAWILSGAVAAGSASLHRASDVEIGFTTLVFSAALSVATGLLFGVFPALRASKASLDVILREGGRGSASATTTQGA